MQRRYIKICQLFLQFLHLLGMWTNQAKMAVRFFGHELEKDQGYKGEAKNFTNFDDMMQ